MTKQHQKILIEALSEQGIVPFYQGDQALVNLLCEIIGEQHRFIQLVAKAALPTDNVNCIDLQHDALELTALPVA